jgi:hypothetical protein
MQYQKAHLEILWNSFKQMTIEEVLQAAGSLLHRRNQWTVRDLLDLLFSLVTFLRMYLWKGKN